VPGSLAVVVGVGGYCVQVVRAFGARVVAIGVDDAKLAAVAAQGAALTLNSRTLDAKGLNWLREWVRRLFARPDPAAVSAR
jgi:6-hydroxycyclohex-1-ene-1-carbonyl-CoA dehydrogenase